MTVQLWTVADICQHLAIKPTAFFTVIRKDPRFPKPVPLLKDPRWDATEVADYIERLKAERDKGAA